MSNTNDTGIRWEEPPASAQGKGLGRWQRIVAELRKRPGEWALVAEDAALSAGMNLRTGAVGGAPTGALEVRTVSAGRPRGRAAIYARWVGDSK